MTKLNNDGLTPGQPVSWEEMVKANANREVEVVEPTGEPVTRESIAKMRKDDVIDLLKAQGVEEPDGNVPELRKQLIAIMFAGD